MDLKDGALILACVGAANWGVVKWFNYNLLSILGTNATVQTVAVGLIAASGIYVLYEKFF